MKPRRYGIELLKEASRKIKREASEYDDPRIWKPENGDVARFLPGTEHDSLPFACFYTHGVQENGRWLVTNCPRTIAKTCPVCEYSLRLRNRNDVDAAKRYARRPNFITNILVRKDQDAPENEGKVFLLQYGKQVHDLWVKTCERLPVYDPHLGADFRFVIGQKNGYPNYEKSVFGPSSVLYGGDERKIGDVMDSLYRLDEFTADSKFPSHLAIETKMIDLIPGYAESVSRAAGPTAATPEPGPSAPAPSRASENARWDDEEADDFFDRMTEVD